MDDDLMGAAGQRLQGYVTLAVTIAARVVEVYAARRRQQAEEARRQGEAFARQVEAQQRTEAVAARYELRAAGSPEWWNTATPEQAAAAYATARSYGQLDPELGGMARFMAGEIERRYGVDAEGLVVREEQRAAEIRQQAEAEAQAAGREQADRAAAVREAEAIEAEIVRHDDVLAKLPPELREEFGRVAVGTGAATGGLQGLVDARAETGGGLHWAPEDPADAAAQTERAAAARRVGAETAEATALVAEANGIDSAVHADGKVDAHERWHDMPVAAADWDDAVRHETLARRLETALPNQPEAVSARLTIDAAQGKPATAATAARPTSKAPAARAPRVKGAERITGR